MFYIERDRLHRMVSELKVAVSCEPNPTGAMAAASAGLSMLITILEPHTQCEDIDGLNYGSDYRPEIVEAHIRGHQTLQDQPVVFTEVPEEAPRHFAAEQADPDPPPVTPADTTAEPPAPLPRKWTEARHAILRECWAMLEIAPDEILRRINAEPGEPTSGKNNLWGEAKRIGLPTSRYEAAERLNSVASQNDRAARIEAEMQHLALETEPLQPARAPAAARLRRCAGASAHSPSKGPLLPSTPLAKERKEAEELFATGMGARAVAEDMGLDLGTVSNWISDWRTAQGKKA